MKLPGIWISADGLFLVVLDKVTSVSPGGTQGSVTVRSGAGVVTLVRESAEDFVAALIRFHIHGFPQTKQPRRKRTT